MPVRSLGQTGLKVSEIGFGAWGIGGDSYGTVDPASALDALARAEEFGCNFVDTAAVYGESEALLGEFLRGRRNRWIVATKYSRRTRSMTASLEEQLKKLRTEAVDLYQVHWAPGRDEFALYEELDSLKRAGKARFVGVSLHSASDIDFVLENARLDAIHVRLSLLDPDPFLQRLERIRASGVGVIIRSSLKEGFLTGKFGRDVVFADPRDQRSRWERRQIVETVEKVEQFRFLEREAGSMLRASVAYPLSFPEVSTVILGTKSRAQADANFGDLPGRRLSDAGLRRVYDSQVRLGLLDRRSRFRDRLRSIIPTRWA